MYLSKMNRNWICFLRKFGCGGHPSGSVSRKWIGSIYIFDSGGLSARAKCRVDALGRGIWPEIDTHSRTWYYWANFVRSFARSLARSAAMEEFAMGQHVRPIVARNFYKNKFATLKNNRKETVETKQKTFFLCFKKLETWQRQLLLFKFCWHVSEAHIWPFKYGQYYLNSNSVTSSLEKIGLTYISRCTQTPTTTTVSPRSPFQLRLS